MESDDSDGWSDFAEQLPILTTKSLYGSAIASITAPAPAPAPHDIPIEGNGAEILPVRPKVSYNII